MKIWLENDLFLYSKYSIEEIRSKMFSLEFTVNLVKGDLGLDINREKEKESYITIPVDNLIAPPNNE